MRCRTRDGRVDFAALAALAASVAALAAVVTAVLVFRAVRQDRQRAAFSTALDALWRCDAEWNSDGMAPVRSAAATALLEGRATRDVDAVLDFFDQVALFVHRGALDEELVWYTFYWPMANYWFASQAHVQHVQRDAPTRWQQLQAVMPRLQAIEARRKQRSLADAAPTQADIRDFMTGEVESGECVEDDEETRKTPL